jgi:hypothetical protein
LTSADGSSIYGKSLTFIEDLALIEETLTSYEQCFKPLQLPELQHKSSSSQSRLKSEVREEGKIKSQPQETPQMMRQYEEEEEEEEEGT